MEHRNLCAGNESGSSIPKGMSASCRLLIALALMWLPCMDASAAPSTEPQTSIEGIRALIGDAACDSDAQCRTIPIGAKACGGPEYYLAWSTKRTDAAQLLDITGGRAGAGNVQPPRRPGAPSNCVLITDPGAYCAPAGGTAGGTAGSKAARACQLRSGQQAGRGPVN